MVVKFSTIFSKERLEDVAEAPGKMVLTLWATEMDTIIAIMITVAIKILL